MNDMTIAPDQIMVREANVAFTVRDEYQNKGIGSELLSYLVYLAKREGLHTLTAEVLVENKPGPVTCTGTCTDIVGRGDGAVIDHQFGTTDVLIILPVSAISARYIGHFGADASRHAA